MTEGREEQRNPLLVQMDLLRLQSRHYFGAVPDCKPTLVPKFRQSLEKRLGGAKSTTISAHQREAALATWNQAQSNQTYEILLSRDMRILCSIREVVQTSHFLNLLGGSGRAITASMACLLLETLHDIWGSGEGAELLRKRLEQFLDEYSGRHPLILHWRRCAERILTVAGPSLLAREMVEYRELPASLSQNYRIKSSSEFMRAVEAQAAKRLLEEIRRDNHDFNEDQWRYLFDYFIQTTHYGLLSDLIHWVNDYSDAEVRDRGIQFLQNWFLSQKDFGDPRIFPGLWENIQEEARTIFVSWLAKQDIKLFFEMIIQNDTQGRKRFWSRYLHLIRGSVIAIGEHDYSMNSKRLEDFQKEGYHYSYLENDNQHNSAFILDFGRYVVVDFSKVGRAYIYDKQTFLTRQQQARSLYFNKQGHPLKIFYIENLKEGQQLNFALEAVAHHSGWLEKLANILSQYGIRP